jgi:ribonuclease D
MCIPWLFVPVCLPNARERAGQAARALEYESFSLAHLLSRHAGVVVDKRLQLADWRVRPLSPEMQRYAREDTHYLLFIYDTLRVELLRRYPPPPLPICVGCAF